jgi:TrmH family RNA methyltransferase
MLSTVGIVRSGFIVSLRTVIAKLCPTETERHMKLDDIKKLHQKKYRQQLGYYLVEGEHLVLELHKAYQQRSQAEHISLFVTEPHAQWAKDLGVSRSVTVLSDKQMAYISDTKTPQGIMACVPLPPPQQSAIPDAQERCIYLYEVQDPGNLGTILRSLAWFGHFRLLLSPNSVDPFNAKVVRASMGAIFHVPIELDVRIETLGQRFSRFACLDLTGAPIADARFNSYPCYLFGNEARGIPTSILRDYAAEAFSIRGTNDIDSLNLANAVSICAYQLSL